MNGLITINGEVYETGHLQEAPGKALSLEGHAVEVAPCYHTECGPFQPKFMDLYGSLRILNGPCWSISRFFRIFQCHNIIEYPYKGPYISLFPSRPWSWVPCACTPQVPLALKISSGSMATHLGKCAMVHQENHDLGISGLEMDCKTPLRSPSRILLGASTVPKNDFAPQWWFLGYCNPHPTSIVLHHHILKWQILPAQDKESCNT